MPNFIVKLLGLTLLEITVEPDEAEEEIEEEETEYNSRLTTSDHSFGFITKLREDYYEDEEEEEE